MPTCGTPSSRNTRVCTEGCWEALTGVPVLAVSVPPVPVSMPSLSETGSEGMPTALPPPESMAVVLSARDACQPQNARG